MRSATVKAIRIVRRPNGPAPEKIRDAWIGLILPLAASSKYPAYSFRSFSKIAIFFNAIWFRLTRKPADIEGYYVESATAISILEHANPIAAQWWRQHTPQLLKPGMLFVFDDAACEETEETIWPPPPDESVW